MSKQLTIWSQRGKEEATITDLLKGDRIITPTGDEYSISWNEQRKAIELIKFYSDNEQDIGITPAVSNHIFIK